MKLKTILKILFVFALFYYLAQKGFLSFRDMASAFRQWKAVGSGFIFLTAAMILGIFRWQILLFAQGIHLPIGRTARLSLIGNFFNIALPGAVSGDFVKAMYVSKEAEGKAAHAFSSILFDRVAGVSALVLISAVAMLLSSTADWSGNLLANLKIFMLLAGAGVVFFYSYLYLLKDHHDPMLHVFSVMARRYPKTATLKRSWEGLRIYRRHRGTVLWALLISILIHGLVITSTALFASALGKDAVALPALFVVVPLGLLVTAIPLTPAGVGTGNYAFGKLFMFLAASPALESILKTLGSNVFNFLLLSQIGYGALGGLVYLRFKKEPGHELPVPGTPVAMP